MVRKRIPDISCRYIFTLINNKDNDVKEKEEVRQDVVTVQNAKIVFREINVTQHGYSEETVQKFFSALDANDTNKDGFLVYQEFRAAFNTLRNAE